MRVYLDQIGCRLNYSEMDTLAQRLQAVGHLTVNAPEKAQIIVFNTCAVTTEAASKSRQRVRQLHKANPAARIAVTGCWVTLQPARAAQLPGVALVADNSRKELLHTLLEPWSAELDDPADLARMQPEGNPFEAEMTAGEDEVEERLARTRAFVKVQDGCNNRCTFCVVTIARGVSQSRSLMSVVEEVQGLVASGIQEAVLTGVHLGSYGRDLNGAVKTDLKQLVAAIMTDTDIARLRLSSLEPWELADGFFDLWQRWPDRLCPHLHLPLQAGTNPQLRRMARRCTADSFRQLVRDARAAIPDLMLTTDLITGFPGETEADFSAGLDYVAEMRFAHAHIFPFSPRAGTVAAKYKEQIPTAVKKERVRRLCAVVEQTGRSERQRFVGTARSVLWEHPKGIVEAEGPGAPTRLWSGFTDNYLRVTTQMPPEVNLHNTFTQVLLDELHGDTLFGTIL